MSLRHYTTADAAFAATLEGVGTVAASTLVGLCKLDPGLKASSFFKF